MTVMTTRRPGGLLVAAVFPVPVTGLAKFVQFCRFYVAGPPYTVTVELVESLLKPVGLDVILTVDPLPAHVQHLRHVAPAAGAADDHHPEAPHRGGEHHQSNPLRFSTSLIVLKKKEVDASC